MNKYHGQTGHFNSHTLDQNSHVTGFGKHARVLATAPQGGELYFRIDMVHGLPEPTERQVLIVAQIETLIKSITGWKLVSWVEYTSKNVERIEVIFEPKF